MRIIPLGTNAGIPTKTRHPAAIAVAFGPLWVLLDCGEGTQMRVIAAPLKLHELDAVFITHLHGDHVYGLPGLIATLAMQERTEPLAIYGPLGIREFLNMNVRVSQIHLTFALDVYELSPGIVRSQSDYTVECAPMNHTVPTFGLRIAAERRVIAYCADTRPCPSCVTLARGADVLIHEATYAHDLREKAQARGHSTARQAAEVALAAGAKRLVLTHFSARYPTDAKLVEEARELFRNTEGAIELQTIELPLRKLAA
ncbi:MAG: ribonuclease Z [Bdellovibrionota bacterium]